MEEQITTALLLKSVTNLSKALFVTLKKEQNEEELALIIEHLQILANSVTGLPMVLRCLLSGAMSASIAPIFGGLTETSKAPKNSSLYDENLKFGAMPTHPLGTSTVFHAGVIGKVDLYLILESSISESSILESSISESSISESSITESSILESYQNLTKIRIFQNIIMWGRHSLKPSNFLTEP